MVSATTQPHTPSTARRFVRLTRPAAVIVTVLATTFVWTGRASAATTTKIKASVTGATLNVTGSGEKDDIALRLRSNDPTTLEVVDVRQAVILSFNRNDFDHIFVSTLENDDTVTVDDSGGVFTDTESTTIDGGRGDDILTGGSGSERLSGGPGADLVNGGRGADVGFLGDGNDTFVWNPGDGSDTVEGQDGTDRLVFNGANLDEKVTLSANGSRLRFFRDIATITMDVDGVENVDFHALGGADTVTVDDLTGTDVTHVDTDLASPAGSGTGDGSADNVIVNGTNGNDTVNVTGKDGTAKVRGLVPTVTIAGAEFTNDRLDINTLIGADTVRSQLAPNDIPLFVNGNPV